MRDLDLGKWNWNFKNFEWTNENNIECFHFTNWLVDIIFFIFFLFWRKNVRRNKILFKHGTQKKLQSNKISTWKIVQLYKPLYKINSITHIFLKNYIPRDLNFNKLTTPKNTRVCTPWLKICVCALIFDWEDQIHNHSNQIEKNYQKSNERIEQKMNRRTILRS